MRGILAIMAASSLVGCASTTTERQLGHTRAQQAVMVAGDVASRSAELAGQSVRVSGFLHYSDDARSLWSSERHLDAVSHGLPPDDAAWDQCIAVYPANERVRARLTSLSRRVVTLTGMVRVQPEQDRDLWACNNVSIVVQHAGPGDSAPN